MGPPIHSVLLLHSGALGDTVLHLRLAQLLRQVLGDACISWIGRDAWLPIVRRCAHIDSLAGLDAMRCHRLFEQEQHTDSDLADWLGGFDLILNALAPDDSPAAARLQRCARRLAVTYDTTPQPNVSAHIVRQWIDRIAAPLSSTWPQLADALLAATEQLIAQPEPLFRPDEPTAAETDAPSAPTQRGDQRTRRVALLHPGSGGQTKCWPLEYYTELAQLLTTRGLEPVLILGPVEMELLGPAIELVRRTHRLVTAPSLPDLMTLAGAAAVYIGNDSGPTHLAAALGTPTLALFGPTDPAIWQPIGPNVTVMTSQHHTANWTDLAPDAAAERASRLAK